MIDNSASRLPACLLIPFSPSSSPAFYADSDSSAIVIIIDVLLPDPRRRTHTHDLSGPQRTSTAARFPLPPENSVDWSRLAEKRGIHYPQESTCVRQKHQTATERREFCLRLVDGRSGILLSLALLIHAWSHGVLSRAVRAIPPFFFVYGVASPVRDPSLPPPTRCLGRCLRGRRYLFQLCQSPRFSPEAVHSRVRTSPHFSSTRLHARTTLICRR